MNAPARKPVLIGTAGHIDHGKTALVARLTGIFADRLPEEKSRGISIDLGFAHWETDDLLIGVVDVPGHEKFVRNMVAGATGIDLALLVVAADDGVMPQTREHLDILQLLGRQSGAIAVTKIDLVDDELLPLVDEELRELTAGTFLEGCPILHVSSETGEGIAELKSLLEEIARKIAVADTAGPFRMPVDRVFSLKGQGTIATGSPQSGTVQAGGTVCCYPAGTEMRIRSVQNYGLAAEQSGPHRRTALNLAGVKIDELHRGDVLGDPGTLIPSRRLIVRFQNLGSSGLEFRSRQRFQLSMGTRDIGVRVRAYDKTIPPGGTGYGELIAEEPLAAVWGERFLMRRETTVGGGVILDPAWPIEKRIREPQTYAQQMASSVPGERLSALMSEFDDALAHPEQLFARAGIVADALPGVVADLESAGKATRLGGGSIVLSTARRDALGRSLLRILSNELDRREPARVLPRVEVLSLASGLAEPAILNGLIGYLLQDKQLIEKGDKLGPADRQPKLTKRQREWQSELLRAIREGSIAPPTRKEIALQLQTDEESLLPLIALSVEDGELIQIADGFLYAPEALEKCRTILAERFTAQESLKLNEIRDAWGITRKHAVPLAEWCDEQGLTRRNGDLRTAGPNLTTPLHSD